MPDGYLRKRNTYGNCGGSQVVGSSTDDTTLVTCKTNYTIYVQRVTLTITTGSTGKTWSIEDSAGSPVSITGAVPCDTAPSNFDFDFGPEGVPLTAGKNLVLNVSATGAVGAVVWEAYQKLSSVVAATSTS